MNHIRDQVAYPDIAQILNQVCDKASDLVWNQVCGQVCDQVAGVRNQVWPQVGKQS